MFQGSFNGVEEVSRAFQRKGVFREFSGCFKEVSRVFHESFREEEVSRMFLDF